MGCNYFWMLCEGVYLHTLIVVAVFAEKQRLLWYHFLGWGKAARALPLSRGAGASDPRPRAPAPVVWPELASELDVLACEGVAPL